MTIRKHIQVDQAARQASIEQSFPGVIAEQRLARVGRSLRADVNRFKAEKASVNPKAEFEALFSTKEDAI